MNQEDKQETLNQCRKGTRWLWAGILGILLVQWGGFAAGWIRRPMVFHSAFERYGQLQKQTEKKAPDLRARVENLKKTNPFMPKPPKPEPPKCTAILGNAAFFDEKWIRVDEEINGAKVTAIDSTTVTLLWEGKELKQFPFGVESNERPSKSEPPRAGRPQPGQDDFRPGPTPGMGPFGGGGGGFMNMSPEERMEMRQRFEQMSPEEREAFRNQMRDRFERGEFGGRGGPGGDGRGRGR